MGDCGNLSQQSPNHTIRFQFSTLTLNPRAAILVVGDLMLDQYIVGAVTRISPEAPVPIVRVTSQTQQLGGCGNVAHNLAALGLQVAICAAAGEDAAAYKIVAQLDQKNILHFLLHDATIPTTTKTRVVGNHQQIVRFDVEQKFEQPEKSIFHWQQHFTETIWSYIVISDYDKGFCSPLLCQKILQQAQQHHTRVIIDPKGNDWEKYRGAYLVAPNLKELADIAQQPLHNDDEAQIAHIGQAVRTRFALDNLLVTRSEKGMTLFQSDGTIRHYPTQAQEVYDVTGAGDTVIATLAASLHAGLDLPTAVHRANLAAGFVVGKFGTYAIQKAELEALVQS